MENLSRKQSFGSLIDKYLDQLKFHSTERAELREKILREMVGTQDSLKKEKLMGMLSEEIKTPVIAPDKPPSSGFSQETPLKPKISLEEAITRKAEEIASWENSYDTLIWLWAETALELKLNSKPERKDIVDLAELYASREKDVDKIQWFLAENLIKLGR